MMQATTSRYNHQSSDIQGHSFNGTMSGINQGTQPNLDNSSSVQTSMRNVWGSNNSQAWSDTRGHRVTSEHVEPARVASVTQNPMIVLAKHDGLTRLSPNPPLTFKESPFYRVLDTIVPPTILTPSSYQFVPGKRPYERQLIFRINKDQVETIVYHSRPSEKCQREFGVQVLIRFGKIESQQLPEIAAAASLICNAPVIPPFTDNMPIHLALSVNGKSVPLPPFLPTSRPNMDGRRNARPVGITPLLRVSPNMDNHVKISWSHEYTSFTYYFYAIYLVQKHSVKELCDDLRARAYHSASTVRKQIVEKLASTSGFGQGDDDDDDLQIQNTLPVQLLCPLSKARITLPVRGCRCPHIQCYDADTYLIINERKPVWKCPVCDAFTPFNELFVDGLLMEILASKESQDVEEIVFNEDGSWTTTKSIVDQPSGSNSPSPGHVQEGVSAPNLKRSASSHEAPVGGSGGDMMIDLTASDDEDAPLPKRPAPVTHSSRSQVPSTSQQQPTSQIGSQSPTMHRMSSGSSSLSGQRAATSNHPRQQPQQYPYQYQQQHQSRTARGCGSSLRLAHSNGNPLASMPSGTAAATPPYHLVDAKPDPRRVFLASLQQASRPCSHSATPSPRTPQSLNSTGSSTTSGGGVSAAMVKPGLPPSSCPSANHFHSSSSAIVAASAATAAAAAMAASYSTGSLSSSDVLQGLSSLYPKLSSQQIMQLMAAMRVPEFTHLAQQQKSSLASPVLSLPPPSHPPKALAHQSNNNGSIHGVPPPATQANLVSLARRSFVPPPPPPQPAHSNLSTSSPSVDATQWRTYNPASTACPPSHHQHNNHLGATLRGAGSGTSLPATATSASSPSLIEFWSVAAAAAAAAAAAHAQSPSSVASTPLIVGARLSPPEAHSNNSSSPPRQGDPRHLESGLIGDNGGTGGGVGFVDHHRQLPPGWSA